MSTAAVVGDPRALRQSLARAEKQRKLRAFSLTLPLLLYLALTFLIPIVVLLKRAVENPEVANALRWRCKAGTARARRRRKPSRR